MNSNSGLNNYGFLLAKLYLLIFNYLNKFAGVKTKIMKNYYFWNNLIINSCFYFSTRMQTDTTLDKQIMRQALAYGDNAIAANSIYRYNCERRCK